MKVGSITTKICKSDTLKKGLELAANNGSKFMAGTQLMFATVIRPLSIATTPKTDRENKKLACAKSFASSFVNYLLVLAVSNPIARNVKKIDKTPERYLKPETIKKMQEGSKPLIESKSYQFATQMFKLGANALTAVPRAIVTCALIPPIMVGIKWLNGKRKKENGELESSHPIPLTKWAREDSQKSLREFSFQTRGNPVDKTFSNFSFKGAKGVDLAKKMGKAIDSPFMQKMSEKYKGTNFQMHTMAVTDTLTTLTLCHQVNANKKIDDDRKKILNNNSLLSTSLGILSGYAVDKFTEKPTEKFIKMFSKINKADPKLSKYVEGIKIVKPTLLYAGVYYTVIPMVSTFFAERLNMKNKNI